MIIEELFEIDGVQHVRHYSDSQLMITSGDGKEYGIAEDLASLGKEYYETETPISDYDVSPDEIEELLKEIL